jgi:hypothetical protein
MPIDPNAEARIKQSTLIRNDLATQDTAPPKPSQNPNKDEALADKIGTYSKALIQDNPGFVNLTAFNAFRAAINKLGFTPPGLHNMPDGILGGTAQLNGPQGAFAFQLNCLDSAQFGPTTVPAAPELSSKEYGTELVELYWASLLRDVPFTEYQNNETAKHAAAELDSAKFKSTYAGPLESDGHVTPRVLFRGGFNKGATTGPMPATDRPKYFAGELSGPYLSQFCFRPTNFGVQDIDQKFYTSPASLDFMVDEATWALVQSGQKTGIDFPLDKQNRRYLHNGRGLSTYTHEDELYQAYFIAYLLMKTLNIPANKTSPYGQMPAVLKSEKPFGTFGGPDIAGTLAAVAKAAIDAVWYQKWVIHLRHRPESGGGLVHLQNKGVVPANTIDANVFSSNALAESKKHYKSDFLSQAFPEGAPTHPAYPTGHGCVAGACITILKFFFEGSTLIPNPMVPSNDGTHLMPYTYTQADGGVMTVNGELHKLAHNISFGHGIHAGIHWRSDTDYSMLLGEEVALSFLKDKVQTYSEKVSITITKMNGQTSAPIGN